MRTGGCTVQQSLTAEAASVLKHSLTLAKRRGHAQLTPLHVAATLLSSSIEATSLFRRACLKFHPLHPNSHPLQCRALELCFNVALNRLPTIPPPSTGPLLPTHPSLSNALIAALKRAQAHQRRGCIEQQQQQQQHQNQQQQPLLAIKVELEQLIISILDDPSVSRVMREAGFSSTCIKNNLEEDTSSASSVFFDPHRGGIINHASFWQTHFLKPPMEQNPPLFSSQKEDLRLVMEVLLGKNKRRSNIAVVGDSVSYTEGLVAELMGRVDKGDVPEELRSAQFIKFQLSSVHIKFMSSSDVEMKVSDLKRKVSSMVSERRGVIIYLGDLRWAVDEEVRVVEAMGGSCGYRAVDHVIAEVGRLQSEWRSCQGGGSASNKVWLMATASYQTYMRCQMRQPSLEVHWALQAVAVPSGGLALSLHAPPPSGQDSKVTALSQNSFMVTESKRFYPIDEQQNLICCAECTSNFEREASSLKSGFANDKSSNASPNLPFWLQPQKQQHHEEEVLIDLRRKWNRLCQRLHHNRHNQTHMYPPFFNPIFVSKTSDYGSFNPLLSNSSHFKKSNIFAEKNSISFLEFTPKSERRSSLPDQSRNCNGELQEKEASKHWLSEVSLDIRRRAEDLRTTLALGCTPSSCIATPRDEIRRVMIDREELYQRLKENIPWQTETIRSIAEAMADHRSGGKGTWLLIQGTDRIGKTRLSLAIADSICGSTSSLVRVNARKPECETNSRAETLMEALEKNVNCVLLVEEIDHADTNFLKCLSEVFETGVFTDPAGRQVTAGEAIFIFTTNSDDVGQSSDSAIELKLEVEEASSDSVGSSDLKRKAESDLLKKVKSPRKSETNLDLNVCAEEQDYGGEDNAPSDLTQEFDTRDLNSPTGFLDSIDMRFDMDSCPNRSRCLSEYYLSRINRSFEEVQCGVGESGRRLSIDETVVEELVAVSGTFLNNLFEKWLKEVFQTCLATVKKGGNVRLSMDGRMGNVGGFQCSSLPSRIHVA